MRKLSQFLPLFIFMIYFNKEIKFLNIEKKTNCVKVPNKKVNLNIDDSLKDKTLLQIEFL